MRRYYQVVWQTRNFGDMVLIKTLFYTGVRVSELVHIRLVDVDLDRCQIRINQGKGGKDRLVPFPDPFKETLALHMAPPAREGGDASIRIVVEEALQRARGAPDAGALRAGGRAGAQRLATPTAPLPVHLAQEAGRR
jgi:integrase